MNEINIAQIKERALCANPGPWKVAIKDGDFFVHMEDGWPIADCHGLNDASYIAAASPDVVLVLIERIERLEKEANWLAEMLENYGFNEEAPSPQSLNFWRQAARKAVEA